ncbi:hypothetical protein NL676_013412 [Syzygium grande]|nr:hypothetical protein NL676_013412 [Syzygium grande]
MITVYGTLHGILLAICSAVVAMIMQPSFGAEIGQVILLVINLTWDPTKDQGMVNKTLLLLATYLAISLYLKPQQLQDRLIFLLRESRSSLFQVQCRQELLLYHLVHISPFLLLISNNLINKILSKSSNSNKHWPFPQQMAPSPMPPPTQLPPLNVPPQGMQGTTNQMVPPVPYGHYMGMNPMHLGSLPSSGGPPPVGGFPGSMPNMQGQSSGGGAQMHPAGGPFNRPQGGQMPMMPGFNPFQPGSKSGMPPPPPPGPPHAKSTGIGKGGVGSVYKAVLASNQIVAVTKLNALESGNVRVVKSQSFENEIRVLTEVRHRNVIKLHGFCSKGGCICLVYEFVERGSLGKALGSC